MSTSIVPFAANFNNGKVNILAKAKSILTCQYVGQRAVASDFVKRKSKLNPNKFFESLLTVIGQEEDLKIQSIITLYNLKCRPEERIDYKPLYNRLDSEGLTRFLLDLLCGLQERTVTSSAGENNLVKELIAALNENNVNIDDILCHDGSYWRLNSELAKIFPGTRNAQKPEQLQDTYDGKGEPVEKETGNAEIGIQSTYSLLKRCPVSISVTPGTVNEREYVYKTVNNNVLHIMDAGYIDFTLFESIDNAGGYFLSKLRSNAAGEIITCKCGKEDLTEMFSGRKLSDPLVRRYKDERANLDMLVSFEGHCYRVVRIWSRKEHKSVCLITNIKQIRLKLLSSRCFTN